LFALGFRPFYLLASVFAVAAILLWLGVYAGAVNFDGYLSGVAWHRHEMIFGFACAVLAGFLLTAVRNWTGRPTPNGAGLAVLAVTWLSGRILLLTGPPLAAAVIDVAFLPVLSLSIALPIVRSANKRNVKLLFVLAGLAGANGAYHLAAFGVLPGAIMAVAATAALDTFVILIAIMGGRVIPAFTASAITGANPRQLLPVEIAAIGTLLLILVAGICEAWWPLSATAWITLLLVAAIAHGARLSFWQPQRTLTVPLLWMLPVAYAWVPVSLGLRALGVAGVISPTAAVHAVTLGAMSGLMLAMMMRSALGHTGRLLSAGVIEIAAFALIQIATIMRVMATFADPANYRGLVVASGLVWAFAFLLFVARYGPWLCQRRIDGQPG
jgi:uncharacterized protein involved in response to NO